MYAYCGIMIKSGADPCHDVAQFACGGWIKENSHLVDSPSHGARLSEKQLERNTFLAYNSFMY